MQIADLEPRGSVILSAAQNLPRCFADPSGPLTMTMLESSFHNTMQLFAPWEHAPHLAVAVSGGADSLALALLAHHWAQQQGGHITALMVDHGLRKEAAQELDQAQQTLSQHGIPSVRQKLHLASPATQAAARFARYEALENWCREHQILHLLLGHHRDDQAETLLMRWLRGSGFDGLSAMAACREAFGLRLLRPLLGIAKTDLQNYLHAKHVRWAEDPSNHHPRYARSHLRALLSPPIAERLAACAQTFGIMRAHDETKLAMLMTQHLIFWPEGVGFMDAGALVHPAAPELLAALLRSVDGSAHPPRTALLSDAVAALRRAEKITLHRCVLEPFTFEGKAGILCYREYQAISHLVIPAQAGIQKAGHAAKRRFTRGMVWLDSRLRGNHKEESVRQWDRFSVSTPPNHTIRALGPEGFRQLKARGLTNHLPAYLPYRVCLPLPAVWHLETCLDAPHITKSDNRQSLRPAKSLGNSAFFAMNRGTLTS